MTAIGSAAGIALDDFDFQLGLRQLRNKQEHSRAKSSFLHNFSHRYR